MTSENSPRSTDATSDAPTDLGGEQAGIAPTARKPKGVKSFADVGVHPDLVEALTTKGFDAPFPIQELTLPIATKGHDVIGQARTGTGKTLAFGLALLGRVTPGGGTQALVVVPTRELCIQVAEELQIGKGRGLRVIAVYGGVGYEEQEAAFTGGHEIVVGTPGRLLDHVNKGNLKLDGVTELVLDEADEMLDMGFLPDVERLIQACGDDRHSMLFSATMPTEVVKLARRYLDQPTFMRADAEPLETAPNVEQHFFQVHRMDKPRVLARILQTPERGGVYVFVRTKHMADRLVRELEDLGSAAIAIHGDLRQSTREKNLDKFRDGSATVLVATEVAARGLDVEGVTHVVNYDCPDDEKMYLHRIGRTARAGNKGAAITFAEFNEVDRLNVIRKKVGATERPVEAVFSPSERLTELFDLPDERPWDAQVAATKSGKRTDRRSDRDDRGSGKGRGRGGESGRGGDRGRGGRGGDRSRDDRGSRGEPATDAGDERKGRSGQTSEDRSKRDDAKGAQAPARDRSRAQGRSDGRPKSSRSAEGRGGSHDAEPERRARARKRDDQGRSGGDDGADTSQRDPDRTEREPDRSKRETASDGGARTRTRTRTRARGGARVRTDRDQDGQAAGGGRADDRGDADSGHDRSGSSSDRSGSGSGRARAERGSGSGRERGRDSEPETSSGRSRQGSDRNRGQGSGGRSQGQGRSGGGSGKGGNRGGRGGGKGGSGSGPGRDRNGRDADRAAPVEVARRGREARGEGSPALARRVKVEHLP